MANASDKAASLMEGLLELQDQISSNRAVMVSHHCSVVVYADTQRELQLRASRLSNVISVGGSTIMHRETRGSMAAYFAQLPGCRDRYRGRPGAIGGQQPQPFRQP